MMPSIVLGVHRALCGLEEHLTHLSAGVDSSHYDRPATLSGALEALLRQRGDRIFSFGWLEGNRALEYAVSVLGTPIRR